MDFKTAYKLPIGEHVEKKGKFNYLSWTHAVRFLRENFPEASWIVHEYENTPLFPAPHGYLVKVSVITDGLQFPQFLPITDNKNKPIPEPNAFDVNTAIQRCLTKAIGIATGIGLGLYSGEDLPVEQETHVYITEAQRKELQQMVADTGSDVDKFLRFAGTDSFETISDKQFPKLKALLVGKMLKDDK
jgi:hypothetical protein